MDSLVAIWRREPATVWAFISLTVALAAIWFALHHQDLASIDSVGLLLLVSVVLFQLLAIPLPPGAASFASVPLLALGFIFGPGAAMAGAVLAGLTRWLASKGRPERAAFDVSDLALSAAVAASIWAAVADMGLLVALVASLASGLAYWLVNVGLLSVAISLSSGASARAVLEDKYLWLAPYMALSALLAHGAQAARLHGPAAVAAAIAPTVVIFLFARHQRGLKR